jgi:hypothetical protein
VPERARRALQRQTIEGPTGSTTIHVDLLVDEKGHFVLEGQDLGAAPQELLGDSDYEYWLRVENTEALFDAMVDELGEPGRDRERSELLVELAASLLETSETPRSDLADWLDRRGIAYSVNSY